MCERDCLCVIAVFSGATCFNQDLRGWLLEYNEWNPLSLDLSYDPDADCSDNAGLRAVVSSCLPSTSGSARAFAFTTQPRVCSWHYVGPGGIGRHMYVGAGVKLTFSKPGQMHAFLFECAFPTVCVLVQALNPQLSSTPSISGLLVMISMASDA